MTANGPLSGSANAARMRPIHEGETGKMTGEGRLSPRKEAILRALVEQYIRTGEPVPSKLLADQLLRVCIRRLASATVRNELAALEEAA